MFSVEDFTEVRREWSAHTQETLRPVSALNHGYIVSNSEKARLTFLFCDHLRDFLRYLHPWRWRWLAFRGVPVLLTPLLAIPILIAALAPIQYTPPDFTPVCVPTCALINTGIYSATMSRERLDNPNQCPLSWVQGKAYPRRRIQLRQDGISGYRSRIGQTVFSNCDSRCSVTLLHPAREAAIR